MSTDDEVLAMNAVRAFMKDAVHAEHIEDMLNNNTRMAVGIEPSKGIIILSMGDEYEIMDAHYADVVASGLLMAVETLRMLEASKGN